MSAFFKFRKLSLVALLAVPLSGCDIIYSTDNCNNYCSGDRPPPSPQVVALTYKAYDQDTESFAPAGYSSMYVKTVDGLLMTPGAAKRENLDPDCFSTIDYTHPDLDNIKLFWDEDEDADKNKSNFTIMFINFDKDGRLESRVLGNTGQANAIKNKIHTVISDTTNADYEQVAKLLSDLGRPTSSTIASAGFEPRDLTDFNPEKTPFFEDLGVEKQSGYTGHVFFYVLLDDHLKFNRIHAATIPYLPDSVETLYSPYKQYEVYPRKGDTTTVEVLPFHFYRGGNMAKHNRDMNDDFNEKEVCIYPYDIGVIAAGHINYPLDTPLLIDPDTEVKGPIGL